MKNFIKVIVVILAVSVLTGIAPVAKTESLAAAIDGYSDVQNPKNFWFKPVYWASEKGITTGYKGGKFKPGNDCTRAQMVTFLWRMKGSPAPKSKTCSFKDVKKSAYYYKPVLWAVDKGITTGYTKTSFKPNNVCTRAQTVTFLWRMAGKPKPKSAKSKFSDIKKSAYYYKAVLWASEKGIVAGYKNGTFKPNEKCLRRQIVTFLWKYSGKPEPKNVPDIKEIKVTAYYSNTRTFTEFGKLTCKAPKLTISGVDTSAVNAALSSYAKASIESFLKLPNNTRFIEYCGYEYYYTQKYVSIYQWSRYEAVDEEPGGSSKGYVISTATGKMLDRTNALKVLGIDPVKFNKDMEKKMDYLMSDIADRAWIKFDSGYRAYNMDQARKAYPYLDGKGNLCYTVEIKAPMGKDYYTISGKMNSSKYKMF